ncbi:Nucleotidyl transferase involved in threonylcarbamoyladenosine formation [Labilithrix luteola]|uniref:Nucleotidyl transferase involved in threonylcarbamoyladenosine formation n=1 Tax=Labilithrix luteola TaxID=1391654 RepID=A0A0K1Q800_9BACT|nr:sugar phosphate nucleotidyltransferase [Labilithrix luteola]AKV01777.1 Nucleotidyl transferase involved in threonylcarbamoyladenosine formation [Labilithrix luteola]
MLDDLAAMVLCAGLGTRLRPLTDELAKPMVPIGDRPAVAHVVERVRLAEPRQVVVNVHHRPDDLHAWAHREGIVVSPEEELLGTAGGLANAAALLGDGNVLVWNGDILSELDPRELVAAFNAEAALAALAVRPRPAGEGNVGIAAGGTIARLRTERFAEEVEGGEFLGIHVVGRTLRATLPRSGCLVGDVYLPALRAGQRLHVFRCGAPFVDVGTLEAYLEANRAWLAARDLSSWSAQSARLDAAIDGSVVGARAHVESSLEGCVVWPDAHVAKGGPLRHAVITPRGIVRAR